MEKKAPNFTLPDQNGKEISLSDYKGKWVILYFYPKDMTSGCTKEAVGFSEKIDEFTKRNAVVIGISKDSVESHKKFADKYNLKITLLSDKDAKVIKEYGAWGKKKMYGKETEGTIRSTFIISPEGEILHEWKNVKVDGHVEEVIKKLDELIAS
ncbi:thioredoxin-dependent thiol peroxidase [Dictyoglomus thermophilum]|uniref:thioredoxin-dependent peroxiredoxin n=2 Tax=Dictyoglomus thermophilum TaxID=14 RepID=B5YC52_DICT6|nr:thioredoxin-dependent thiol peroxidase [Dictyoglomus thermophilum]ACI19755.1 bacterioferritin comigratory protein [Dictyoglomus thermophilum H-6-12]MCX7720043.1 thioredoxin-dependent thiol peroxidase [Dictyoglomus thermophilum]TYT23452.1 thioredoxin-dependent thiol peroxidase [Dictyoglomus thermophilum]